MKRMARTLVAVACLLGVAWAQPELPTVRLSSFEVSTDEPLRVSAEGLEPDAEYVLRLTGPGETQEEVAVASGTGTLEAALRLETPGSWHLSLAGPRLEEARLSVRAGAGPAAPTGAPTGPDQGARPPPQDETAPGAEAPPSRAPNDLPGESATQEAQPDELPDEPRLNEPLTDELQPDEPQPDEPSSDEGSPDAARTGSPVEAPTADPPPTETPQDETARELDRLGQVAPAPGVQPDTRPATQPDAPSDEAAEPGTEPDAELEPTPQPAEPDAASPEDDAAARRRYAAALERATSFEEYASLAQELVALGDYALADEAMRAALSDFAARGYDPRLLALEAHERYNLPLRPFERARARGDAQAAAFWAGWLRYFAVPEAPEVRSALLSYADGLRAAGDRDAAQRVQTTLPPPRDTAAVGTLETTALSIGRSGWLIALALMLAYGALHLVLAAKYQRAQQINLERRRMLKKPVRPLSWLMLIRYYSFTEKLILVLLLLGAALASALAAWFERSAPDGLILSALGSGVVSDTLAQDILADPGLGGERGAFVRGYAAQVSGDDAAAAEFYRQAGRYPPALNNLGVLERSQARFQEALRLSAEVPEARYNLGETPDDFPFQRDFLPGEPVLAVPMARDVQIARAGNWDQAVSGLFVNPWVGLEGSRPSGMAPWLWTLLLVLGLLFVLVAVLWLFVPRMTWIRKAPRPWYYQLLALLVPGSGLADEMWGLLLIVPWAVAGTDALAEAFRWELGIGTGLTPFGNLVVLVVVYLINLAAVVIEYLSYRRRMRGLVRDNPALAEEFGLIAPRAEPPYP